MTLVVSGEPVEGDHPGLLGLVHRAPGHPLVRVLLGDHGVELALDAGDLGDPVGHRVAGLLDPLDSLHELREGLELGPLVVGGGDRDGHLDRLFDCAHAHPVARTGALKPRTPSPSGLAQPLVKMITVP